MQTIEEEVDDIVNAPNFTTKYCGSFYKFGTHGFIYRWTAISKEWLKSTVESYSLREPIANKIKKARKKKAMVKMEID